MMAFPDELTLIDDKQTVWAGFILSIWIFLSFSINSFKNFYLSIGKMSIDVNVNQTYKECNVTKSAPDKKEITLKIKGIL